MTYPEYILTLSCLDQRGIVHRVSGFLADHGCNIVDSAQFGDAQSRLFFMRVHFTAEDASFGEAALRTAFGLIAEPLQMAWQLRVWQDWPQPTCWRRCRPGLRQSAGRLLR